jgi:hypothetical protein
MSSSSSQIPIGQETNLTVLLAFVQYGETFFDFPHDFQAPAVLDPNYMPPDRAKSTLVLVSVMLAVAVIVVSARLYVRKFINPRHLGIDDYLITLAMVRLSFLSESVMTVTNKLNTA